MSRPVGWRYESVRHALAAKGVRTGMGYQNMRYFADNDEKDKKDAGPEEFYRKIGDFTIIKSTDGKYEVKHIGGWSATVNAENIDEAYNSGFGRWKQQERSKAEARGSEEGAAKEASATVEEKKEKLKLEAEELKQKLELSGLQKASAERAAKGISRQEALEKNFGYRTVEAIKRGSLSVIGEKGESVSISDALDRLQADDPGGYATARRELGMKAVQYAQAGQELPKDVLEQLPPLTQKTVENELKAFRERTGTKTVGEKVLAGAKATGKYIGTGVLGTEELGVRGVGEGISATKKGFDVEAALAKEGLAGKGGGFFDDNPLLSEKFSGTFNPMKDLEGKESMSMFAEDLLGPKSMMGTRKTFNKAVEDEVNELVQAKDNLAKVDLSPFSAGEKAFEQGNREGLLKSINAIESQEQLLADRWNLVEQTRAVVLSPQARAQAYVQDDSTLGGILGGAGGDKLAERTDKLAKVKQAIKDSSNELYARKKLLRYKLQRMDAAAGAISDTSLPREDIKILGNNRGKLFNELAGMNPVLDPVGTTQQVFGKKEG